MTNLNVSMLKDPMIRRFLLAGIQANRQPVSVKYLFEHPDTPAYLYSHTKSEVGLDPWTVIQGVDQSRDCDFIYFIDIGHQLTVSHDFIVFI